MPQITLSSLCLFYSCFIGPDCPTDSTIKSMRTTCFKAQHQGRHTTLIHFTCTPILVADNNAVSQVSAGVLHLVSPDSVYESQQINCSLQRYRKKIIFSIEAKPVAKIEETTQAIPNYLIHCRSRAGSRTSVDINVLLHQSRDSRSLTFLTDAQEERSFSYVPEDGLTFERSLERSVQMTYNRCASSTAEEDPGFQLTFEGCSILSVHIKSICREAAPSVQQTPTRENNKTRSL